MMYFSFVIRETFLFVSLFNYRGVLVDKQYSTIASTTFWLDNFFYFRINFNDTIRTVLGIVAEIDQQCLLYGSVRQFFSPFLKF